MRKCSRKAKAVTLVLALVTCLFAGCSNSKKAEDVSNKTEATVTEAAKPEDNKAADGATETKTDDFTYPIQGEKTLSMNWGAGGDLYDESEMKDWYKDYNWQKRIKEETGVSLVDVGGKYGSSTPSDEFMLLLASGEYPDIFRANWVSFPGGPNAAMDDDYIIPLNDVIDQYMPNFKAYLEQHPDIAKMVRTDEGVYYALPIVNENPEPAMGLVIRKDWLDELGLSVPTTLDELHEVLTQFKTKKNCASPMSFELRWMFQQYGTAALSSAYDTLYPFYVEDSTVKYGPMEDSYKDFITMIHDWYAEGLLDADLASVDKSTVQAKFASGEAGVSIEMLSNIKNGVIANKDTGAQYEVIALSTLTKNAGEAPKFCSYNGIYTGDSGFSISTSCKDIETAARWMDYMYSEAGNNLLKYGTEGVSYEIVDGQVKFTDFVLNNPNESNPATVLGYMTKSSSWAQYISNPATVREQYELDIVDTWRTEMEQYFMPAVTFTTDEASYINANYSNVDTYAREAITKFILGTDDLSNYDSLKSTLSSYGIDKILEYRQAAYDRFIAR